MYPFFFSVFALSGKGCFMVCVDFLLGVTWACIVVEEVSCFIYLFIFPDGEGWVRWYNLECLWESCGWYCFCAFALPLDWARCPADYSIGSPVIPGSVYSSRPSWILSVINFLNFHGGWGGAVRSSLAVSDLGLNAPTSVVPSQTQSPILKFSISSFHFLCLIFCPTSFQWA